MRKRILSAAAAAFFGLSGVLAVAAPAQATSDGPAVIPAWSCGPGEVRVDPDGRVGPIRLKVDGNVVWAADKLAEPAIVPVEAGTVVAEVKGNDGWKQVGEHDWKLPGWCKPVDVDVDLPTCKCLDQVITATNPNASGWLWVQIGDNKPVKLTAGEHVTVKVRADVTVSAGWNPKWLKVVKELPYKAPECSTPSPSPSPSATPTGGPESTPTPVVTTPAHMSPSPLPSVVPAGQVDEQPRLPTTGASVTGVVIAGVVLLAAGGVALYLTRRRRTGQHFAA